MKAIALTAFFAATLLCALGADKSFIPKWTHGISSTVFSGNQAQNPASRATCDPTVFTSCLLTFFGSIGLSSPNLPSDTEFEQQLSIHVLQNPPQGFKDTC
uniref:Adipokinetic hormone 1 n=1 Tax=Plectus sambesii TaxID=2011161 RepID=A0A914WTI9_9BILA